MFSLSKKEKGGENIPDFQPPELEGALRRKLQILNEEWFMESAFKSEEVAALNCKYEPTQGPFIIVPAMAKEEATADF